MKILRKYWCAALAALMVAALSGCSSVTAVQPTSSFPVGANWVLLPIVNVAQTPQAGQRAESIAATMLRKRGVADLTHYPVSSTQDGLPELNDAKRYANALQWAKAQGYQLGLSGTVSEWSYKTGLDGEPAVGITLNVIYVPTGQVVWSASGARTGWGFDSVSGTAQELIGKLISNLPLDHSKSGEQSKP